MARRRRKSKSAESDSSEGMDTRSTASTSSGMDTSRLSNDTDAPFIPLYSEDRTTQFGLFTLYPRTHAITNLATSLEACSYPLRITIHPNQQSDQYWVGDAGTAVSSILEALPRIVTTPGDLNDTQIRAQIQTYFEGIIDLLALYMPVAAMKGYSAEYPAVSGYIDNYLASVGAKPWQIRQMQTTWRSLVVPPALVKYCEGFYKVKQHPRVANMHHFMPIAAYNTNESGTATEIYKHFQERFTTMKAAITDYEEFLNLMSIGGYPKVDMPDMIGVSREAKDYELQVNGALYTTEDSGVYYSLPNSGYKVQTLSVCRYVHDSGPSLARGLTPTYINVNSATYDASTKTFTNSANIRTLSTGFQRLASFGGVRKTRAGYLNMFAPNGIPAVYPSHTGAIPSNLDQALATSVSDNAAVCELASQNNNHSWTAAISGDLTARGSAEMQVSNTVDPNVMIAGNTQAASSANLPNLKEIYDALLLPS